MYLPRLKELRQENGFTLKQVAEAIGLTVRTVRRHEEIGINKPLTAICPYADLYDVSIDYLVGRCPERSNKKTER